MLSGSANLQDYKAKAQYVCSLSYSGVQNYHDANHLVDTDSKLAELMPYFCFMTTYVYVLLIGKRERETIMKYLPGRCDLTLFCCSVMSLILTHTPFVYELFITRMQS